jgi:hypothetical protein
MDKPAIYSETLCEKMMARVCLAFGEGGDAVDETTSENSSRPPRTICRTNNPAGAASVRRSRCWPY